MSEAMGHDLGGSESETSFTLRLLKDRRRSLLFPVPDSRDDFEDANGSPRPMVPLRSESLPIEHLQELLIERGLDDPALRLRELSEIEQMRDLEIARLEDDLAEKSNRIFELETALFHARRRADDLDRRWNELARTYERTAERLIEAGGRLEAIETQAGYHAVLRLAGMLRRQPAVYSTLRKVARRFLFGDRQRSETEVGDTRSPA